MDISLMCLAMIDWFRRQTIKHATKAVQKVIALVEEYEDYKDTLEYKDFKTTIRSIVFPKKKKDEGK